jgi:competence protein ComEC
MTFLLYGLKKAHGWVFSTTLLVFSSVTPGRPIIRLSVLAFLAGILLVQQLAKLPSLAWAWLLVPLAFTAWRWPRFGLPVLFLLAGCLWVTLRAGSLLADRLPTELEGTDLRVEGRIADLPVTGERGLRFVFDIERAWQNNQPVDVPRTVQLSIHGATPVLRVGDAWTFNVRLKRPHGFQNPGGFDYEAHLFQQRIRATGYVREHEPHRLIAPLGTLADGVLPGYRLNRFRQVLSARIQTLLPDNRFAPMITAFANGDDDAIPDDQWQVLTHTGTGHLIAISGMNIGLVAGLVFFLARWLWSLPGVTVLWVAAPLIAAGFALLAALGYAALAGFAIPTQRALVMLTVVLGGVFLRRRTTPSVLLAVALLAVLLVDPLAVMSPGFWLSFAAVAVILYALSGAAAEGWKARLAAWGRIQWVVALGLLPLLLFLFQQASLIGPFANLAAIPVVETVVIPATLLGVAGSFFLPDSLVAWPFLLAAQAMALLWPLLELLANLEGMQWAQHNPPLWTLAAALVGILLLLAPRGFPARWLGAVWLLPIFLVRPAMPAPGEAWLTLLDVGQGLSAVVQTAGHTLVYDTGARLSARFDAGRAVVVPFLRHAGVTHVDALIVSHGDNDHLGGSASLLAAMPVARVLSSVPERLVNAEPCRSGQAWEWDGVRLSILHPQADSRLEGNNRSCVLRVESRFGVALLPGDIAARAERELLVRADEALRADILVVPHHGSKSSSTESFLDAVRPGVALLPVGYRNRYRHPHPVVVARYRERGIALEDSASAGAITLRLGEQGLQRRRYRETEHRYWQGE